MDLSAMASGHDFLATDDLIDYFTEKDCAGWFVRSSAPAFRSDRW